MVVAKSALEQTPQSQGVYLFKSTTGHVLYVGKAKNIKKRIRSYFAKNLSIKTARLMQEAQVLETIVTASENEALLLEDTLIKKYLPKFNILLRDDKSYPYIWFSSDPFSLLRFRHRKQSRKKQGTYFGPYISRNSLRFSIDTIEKTFRLRTCGNSQFKTRQKPCLKYQIGCCSAPCVGLISIAQYQKDVKSAKAFLANADFSIIEKLSTQMQAASRETHFEKALELRDKITKLRQIQQQRSQTMVLAQADADIWAIALEDDHAFINLLVVRSGKVQTNLPFSSDLPQASSSAQVMNETVKQYYLRLPAQQRPQNIITPCTLEDKQALCATLNNNSKKIVVNLQTPSKRLHKDWLAISQKNAESAAHHFSKKSGAFSRYFAQLLACTPLTRLDKVECFDISHMGGKHTVGVMTSATKGGLQKKDYRLFNIAHAKEADDYAAIFEAVRRRFAYTAHSKSKKKTKQ